MKYIILYILCVLTIGCASNRVLTESQAIHKLHKIQRTISQIPISTDVAIDTEIVYKINIVAKNRVCSDTFVLYVNSK